MPDSHIGMLGPSRWRVSVRHAAQALEQRQEISLYIPPIVVETDHDERTDVEVGSRKALQQLATRRSVLRHHERIEQDLITLDGQHRQQRVQRLNVEWLPRDKMCHRSG
jgi:hypothetical protein